jgi:hypothetical protein
MMTGWRISTTCGHDINWHGHCNIKPSALSKIAIMPNGPPLVHNRFHRLWLWLGLCLGAATGLAIGWLIAG